MVGLTGEEIPFEPKLLQMLTLLRQHPTNVIFDWVSEFKNKGKSLGVRGEVGAGQDESSCDQRRVSCGHTAKKNIYICIAISFSAAVAILRSQNVLDNAKGDET